MICKVNNLLKIIVLLLLYVTVILGDCTINYSSDSLIKPHLSKKLGRRTIQISNSNEFTTIRSNQKIIASCDTQFEEPEDFKGVRVLSISCTEDSEIYLECASIKWDLYELSEPFVWCPSSMASYILAGSNEGILAGICYDTDNMTLTSIFYTMATRQHKNLHPSGLETYNSVPRQIIENVKDTFESKSISYENYNNKQIKNWMKYANYQYNSIIQNPTLYNEVYNEFGSLLHFQWWPNLRLNNWQIYEEALAKHIENGSMAYDILAGISGEVMVPTKETCENNYTMKTVIDNNNTKIPLYVWNYLHSTVDSAENNGIVVIGFNSPFNDLYSKTDVVFCTDICGKIDWLKNVHSTFHYSTMGIIFCCSVDEVRSSKHLNGFPQYMTKPIEESTTAPPEITNCYESITEQYIEDDDNNIDGENGNDY